MRSMLAGGVLCVNNEYTTDWHLFPGRRAVFGTAPEHVRAHVLENPGIVAYAKAHMNQPNMNQPNINQPNKADAGRAERGRH